MTRIIAGRWRGRTLATPRSDRTRPTSDRVREALFSRLGSWDALVGADVLDLFAGTGALGLEALSRGSRSALLVEAHRGTARLIEQNAQALGASIVRDPAATVLPDPEDPALAAVRAEKVDAFLGRLPRAAEPAASAFDLVFMDPPYADDAADIVRALEQLGRARALRPDAVVVVERSRRSAVVGWPAGFRDLGRTDYGETVLAWGEWAGGPDTVDP